MSKIVITFMIFISLFKLFGWKERKVHFKAENRDLIQICIEKDQELIQNTVGRIPADMTNKMSALSRIMCGCFIESKATQSNKNTSKDASLTFTTEQAKIDESYNCLYSKFKIKKKFIERTAREILAHNNNLECIDLLNNRARDFMKNFGVSQKNRAQFIYTLCSCNNPFKYFITNEDRIPKSEVLISGLFGELLFEMRSSENSFSIPKQHALSCIEFIKTDEE
jgi:hypothetical protein